MKALFNSVSSDYYTRQYEITPEVTFGHKATVYAVCALNPSGMNGDKYSLDLFFSVDGYAARDYIVGISFGTGEMERAALDAEIDSWVRQYLDRDLITRIHRYLKKEQMWEEYSDTLPIEDSL